MQSEGAPPREAELVKSIPEDELLHLLPPNSRLLLGLLGGPSKKSGGQKKKGGGRKRKGGANKRVNRKK